MATTQGGSGDRDADAGIRLLSAALALAATALFFLSELRRRVQHGRRELATALVIQASAAALTFLAGLRSHPSFRLWQPFVGGPAFVLLQALGWILVTIGLVMGLMVLHNISSAAMVFGGCAALGLSNLFALGVLNVSIPHFAVPPSTAAVAAGPALSPPVTTFHVCRGPRIYLAGILTALGLGMVVWSDILAFSPDQGASSSPRLVSAAVLCFVVASALVHWQGRCAFPTYRWWMPFQGGYRFVLLQGLGWLFVAVSIDLLLVFQLVDQGLELTGVGALAVLGQVVLIASLGHFEPDDTFAAYSVSSGSARSLGTSGGAVRTTSGGGASGPSEPSVKLTLPVAAGFILAALGFLTFLLAATSDPAHDTIGGEGAGWCWSDSAGFVAALRGLRRLSDALLGRLNSEMKVKVAMGLTFGAAPVVHQALALGDVFFPKSMR